MKYKLFEGKNVQEAINLAFKEGYDIADFKTAYDWKKKKKFNNWIDTATVVKNGDIRKATKKELINMKNFVDNQGRWLVLGYYYISNILGGSYDFDDGGRVLGVKK